MTDKKNGEIKEVLEVLQAVEEKENITQRHLAKSMGIALGLANSYLRRCIKKGLVKVSQAPANRYLYYLTPKGFAEKSRLTAEYLTESFSFYRKASESLQLIFSQCAANDWYNVLLVGQSDLAEIACLKAAGENLTIVGILDPEVKGVNTFFNIPMFYDINDTPDFDVCILVDLKSSAKVAEMLISQIGTGKLLVPELLKRYFSVKELKIN